MADSRALEILRRTSSLASDRANFDNLWQQIAERMLPGSAQFNTLQSPGQKQTEKMFDATAALALRKYATILESVLTPRNQRWHRLKPADDALEESTAVKEYLEEINKILFRARYAPPSNFTGQIGAGYLELGAFGNSPLFVDEEVGRGVRYRTLTLSNTYFVENHAGIVDCIYRKMKISAANAVRRWGARCPPQIAAQAERSPDSLFDFVHCIEPNNGDSGDGLLREHRFRSTYASETGGVIVQSGGYYTWPVPIMRDLTSAGEVYGRSPGTWVLPDVKMLNEMNRTVIRQAQRAVEPPMLLTEDGSLQPFSLSPGHLNYGTIGPSGEQLAKPLDVGARLDIGLEMMQAKQQVINEAFFITLFQILVENPTMTATEVLERAQEKGMLLGPLMGRQQSEFLGPMIERELDILARAGQLPEMPQELLESGGEYKVEYESPLARAQRAEEGVAIVRTFEVMTPLAELRPDIFDNFDLDKTFRALGEINGMAAKLMRDPKDVESLREERSQQQEMMAAAQVAPGVAKGVKDLASIQQGAA